jgi:thymidine phosphorylase
MSGRYFAQELIRAKRDGRALTGDELRWLVDGIAGDGLSDAQVAAFAMCVFFRDLEPSERAALTGAMRDSGTVLDWSQAVDRPVLDKHSTGGVGDKVSLPLAPILAACGAAVPMISGRGLGHTGGTLDKLESIPGYDTAPAPDRFRAVVAEVGCAIVGQTADLAPADKRLYAIRDATGSVESIPLIVASILSKKLAAGLQGLVMDVKHGSGAFMAELDRARELANALVDVARANGLPTVAVLTDMNSVLGHAAGNAVEVRESLDMLRDPARADPRLREVTLELARRLLELGGLDAGRAEEALSSGAAAERFAAMVAALGGPADLLERPGEHLPAAPVVRPVPPQAAGTVRAHATRDLGVAVMALGGGRRTEAGRIDHAVGLTRIAPVGAPVGPDAPLAVVHARDDAAWEEAAAAVRSAVEVARDGEVPAPASAVTEIVR